MSLIFLMGDRKDGHHILGKMEWNPPRGGEEIEATRSLVEHTSTETIYKMEDRAGGNAIVVDRPDVFQLSTTKDETLLLDGDFKVKGDLILDAENGGVGRASDPVE